MISQKLKTTGMKVMIEALVTTRNEHELLNLQSLLLDFTTLEKNNTSNRKYPYDSHKNFPLIAFIVIL